MKPEHADFGVTVDFRKGTSDPAKVFESVAVLLDGFQRLDRLLFCSLDPHLESKQVLEEVETGSVTAWVRNKLRQTDDQIISSGDWKKAAGATALKAKYLVLDYLDSREEAKEAARLCQLRDDLEKIISQQQLRHIPMPRDIRLDQLVGPLDRIQDAKRLLTTQDRMIIRSGSTEHEVDLSATKKPSDFLAEAVSEVQKGSMPMILLVRKPDYLGDTLWEFRHGKQTIDAYVRDEEWLRSFRTGNQVIVPGSALSCIVDYEYGYSDRGELKTQKHSVTKVINVINRIEQQGALPF